jgi:hypothetical protein
MNEYEEIREAIDIYLMKRFKYRRSLVYLTSDNIVTTRRNNRVDLYLRIRRVKSLFPSDCFIIARINFNKEHVGHGSHFVGFLAETAIKYGFKHIGIESTNHKSRTFAEKLGFWSIDGSNYAISVEKLIQNRG